MPYQTNGKRDYAKEKKLYEDKHPERKVARVERNAARAELVKTGQVHKGDGKDVDHIKPLSKGGSASKSNLRAVPASQNRSFSRNANGSLKSQTSKKESKRK